MTTLIEKDSPTSTLLSIAIALILLIGGAGLVFGYINGTFGEKTTVIENKKTIENKTVVLTSQDHIQVPEKPGPMPAH